MQIGSRPRRRMLTNLTPLVDVVFILVLFYILSFSLTNWRAIDLGRAAAGGERQGAPAALLVRVHPERRLDLNGEPIALAALLERLQARAAADPATMVLIQPKGAVPLQDVVALVDALAAAGIAHVSLTR